MANTALTWQPSQCHRFPHSATHQAPTAPQFFGPQCRETPDFSMPRAHNSTDSSPLSWRHGDCNPTWGATSSRGRHHCYTSRRSRRSAHVREIVGVTHLKKKKKTQNPKIFCLIRDVTLSRKHELWKFNLNHLFFFLNKFCLRSHII